MKSAAFFPSMRGVGKIPRARMCLDCKKKSRFEAVRRFEAKSNPERKRRWHNDPDYRARQIISARKYKAGNREKIASQNKEMRRLRKLRVFEKYGGKCACCGEGRFEFLCIDHVDDDGGVERMTLQVAGIYRKLETLPVMEGYQVLCHNCNLAKAFYGYSPANPDFFPNQRKERKR